MTTGAPLFRRRPSISVASFAPARPLYFGALGRRSAGSQTGKDPDMTLLHLKDNLENLDTPCRCDNCDWRGKAADLDVIEDAEERLDPGSEVPAGACPDCGFLAYLWAPKKAVSDRLARGAISALLDQVGQMRRMFGDDDGAIQDAVDAGEEALAVLRGQGQGDHAKERPPLAAVSTLRAARAFIAGFEGDELQEGISALLARIDRAISAAPVYLAVHVDGGCVQGVSSNDPDALAGVGVILIDHDNEGEVEPGSFAVQYLDGESVTVCGGPLSVDASCVDLPATWANAETAAA